MWDQCYVYVYDGGLGQYGEQLQLCVYQVVLYLYVEGSELLLLYVGLCVLLQQWIGQQLGGCEFVVGIDELGVGYGYYVFVYQEYVFGFGLAGLFGVECGIEIGFFKKERLGVWLQVDGYVWMCFQEGVQVWQQLLCGEGWYYVQLQCIVMVIV